MHVRDELGDLGMFFPLYKAPLDTVSGLVENQTCATCARDRSHLFGLDSNDYLLDPCPACGDLVGLSLASSDESAEPSICVRCSTRSYWPQTRPRDVVAVCYECLRAGRAAIAHETEVGDIDLLHAWQGLARFGRPETARREGLATTVLETYADGTQSIGVRLPQDLLFELLRTPRHQALQREYWPYHCGGFTAYLGRWQQEDFEHQAPGRGREWFGERVAPGEPWEDMWEWLPGDVGWSCVYQCQACARHRVFVDSD